MVIVLSLIARIAAPTRRIASRKLTGQIHNSRLAL